MSDENVESTNRLSEISEEAPQVAKEVDVQPPLKDHIKTAEFQLGLENWSLHHGIVTPPSDQRLEENSTYMDTGAKNHYLEIPGSESNFDENSSIVLGCSRNKECGEKESIESNVNYNSELSDCEGTEGIDTQETVPSPTANIENNNSEEIEVPVEFIKDKDWKKIKESSKVITESLCTSISPIELSASKNCYTSTKFSNSAIMYTPDQDEECDSPSYNSEVAENHVYFENGICNEEEIQTDECDNQSENSSEVMSVQQEPKCLDVSVEKDSNKNLLLKKSNENISNLPATPEQAHEVLNTSKTIHNKEIATKDVTSLNKNAEILINASNSDVVKRKLPDFFESPGKNIENVATPSKDLDEELQYTFSGPLKSATKQSSLIPTVKNNFITSSSSSSSLSSPAYEVIKAKEFQNELKRINNINIHELKQNCIVDRKARIASPMTRIETLQNYHESRKRRSDLWWQRENSNFVLDPTESLQIQAVRRTDKMLMMRVAVRLERLPLNKIPNHRQHHREQHHHTQVHNTTGSRIQIMYINDPNNTKEDYRTNTSEDYNYQHLNAPLKGTVTSPLHHNILEHNASLNIITNKTSDNQFSGSCAPLEISDSLSECSFIESDSHSNKENSLNFVVTIPMENNCLEYAKPIPDSFLVSTNCAYIDADTENGQIKYFEGLEDGSKIVCLPSEVPPVDTFDSCSLLISAEIQNNNFPVDQTSETDLLETENILYDSIVIDDSQVVEIENCCTEASDDGLLNHLSDDVQVHEDDLNVIENVVQNDLPVLSSCVDDLIKQSVPLLAENSNYLPESNNFEKPFEFESQSVNDLETPTVCKKKVSNSKKSHLSDSSHSVKHREKDKAQKHSFNSLNASSYSFLNVVATDESCNETSVPNTSLIPRVPSTSENFDLSNPDSDPPKSYSNRNCKYDIFRKSAAAVKIQNAKQNPPKIQSHSTDSRPTSPKSRKETYSVDLFEESLIIKLQKKRKRTSHKKHSHSETPIKEQATKNSENIDSLNQPLSIEHPYKKSKKSKRHSKDSSTNSIRKSKRSSKQNKTPNCDFDSKNQFKFSKDSKTNDCDLSSSSKSQSKISKDNLPKHSKKTSTSSSLCDKLHSTSVIYSTHQNSLEQFASVQVQNKKKSSTNKKVELVKDLLNQTSLKLQSVNVVNDVFPSTSKSQSQSKKNIAEKTLNPVDPVIFSKNLPNNDSLVIPAQQQNNLNSIKKVDQGCKNDLIKQSLLSAAINQTSPNMSYPSNSLTSEPFASANSVHINKPNIHLLKQPFSNIQTSHKQKIVESVYHDSSTTYNKPSIKENVTDLSKTAAPEMNVNYKSPLKSSHTIASFKNQTFASNYKDDILKQSMAAANILPTNFSNSSVTADDLLIQPAAIASIPPSNGNIAFSNQPINQHHSIKSFNQPAVNIQPANPFANQPLNPPTHSLASFKNQTTAPNVQQANLNINYPNINQHSAENQVNYRTATAKSNALYENGLPTINNYAQTNYLNLSMEITPASFIPQIPPLSNIQNGGDLNPTDAIDFPKFSENLIRFMNENEYNPSNNNRAKRPLFLYNSTEPKYDYPGMVFTPVSNYQPANNQDSSTYSEEIYLPFKKRKENHTIRNEEGYPSDPAVSVGDIPAPMFEHLKRLKK